MKISKIIILVFAFILAVFPSGCSAKNGGSRAVLQIGNRIIKINASESELDCAPVIKNGRTLLPLRAVVEGLGGSAGWDGEIKTAVFAKGEKVIFMTIGSRTAFVNTEECQMDTEPIIIEGRTMLPIRFVAENLGFSVEWNEKTKEITVSEE